MNKFSPLFIAIIVLFSCNKSESTNEQESKTLLLEKKKIECSFEKHSDHIYVRTNIDFELEPEDYCYWIEYKAEKDSILVDIDKNWFTDKRSCNLILTNEQYNISDTLFILQEGYKPDIGGGSSGSGSGNNNPGSDSGDNSGGNINNGGTSVSRQCAAYTKKGKRCKRTASKGSIYCWQHK